MQIEEKIIDAFRHGQERLLIMDEKDAPGPGTVFPYKGGAVKVKAVKPGRLNRVGLVVSDLKTS